MQVRPSHGKAFCCVFLDGLVGRNFLRSAYCFFLAVKPGPRLRPMLIRVILAFLAILTIISLRILSIRVERRSDSETFRLFFNRGGGCECEER